MWTHWKWKHWMGNFIGFCGLATWRISKKCLQNAYLHPNSIADDNVAIWIRWLTIFSTLPHCLSDKNTGYSCRWCPNWRGRENEWKVENLFFYFLFLYSKIIKWKKKIRPLSRPRTFRSRGYKFGGIQRNTGYRSLLRIDNINRRSQNNKKSARRQLCIFTWVILNFIFRTSY